jgi:hypothetical protein
VTDLAGVLTHHNNLARDGSNVQEYALATSVVNTTNFGKLFSCAVDAPDYTQPLWIPSFTIGGSAHNLILVATQNDSLYAFDADANPCVQFWQSNLIDGPHGGTSGETSVPTALVGNGFQDIQPTIGVTGTPVIDATTGTLYVVSKSVDGSLNFHQRLHAIDIASGNEKFGGPVEIAASVQGSGDGSLGGLLQFDPRNQHQRAALTLTGGRVYIAWAAHEDHDPYHSWVLGYDAQTLSQVAVFNGTPNGSRGGTWMAGGGPAVDAAGHMYLNTGNGTFDANQAAAPNTDYGDTVLRLDLANGLAPSDWFTPFNQDALSNADLDLGSSGVLLLPDQPQAPSHLLVSGGKQGILYVMNRDAMGHYCAACTTVDTNVVQSFQAFVGFFGTPAFWQNTLFFGGSVQGTADNLKAFEWNSSTGQFAVTPSSQSVQVFNFPGAVPSVSSQGTSDGIVWAIDSSAYGVPSPFNQGPAILHAFDATNLANELWNSSQATGGRDQAGGAVKFTVPTVANGKVYIGTRSEIDVYGLIRN